VKWQGFSKVEKGLKRELMAHKVLKFMLWQLKRMFHDQLSEGETPFEKQSILNLI